MYANSKGERNGKQGQFFLYGSNSTIRQGKIIATRVKNNVVVYDIDIAGRQLKVTNAVAEDIVKIKEYLQLKKNKKKAKEKVKSQLKQVCIRMNEYQKNEKQEKILGKKKAFLLAAYHKFKVAIPMDLSTLTFYAVKTTTKEIASVKVLFTKPINKCSLRKVNEGSNKLIYVDNNFNILYAVVKDNNPYDILGLLPSASKQEIKKAFKQMALKKHPNKNKINDKMKATEAFQNLQNAMEMALNALNRKTNQHAKYLIEAENDTPQTMEDVGQDPDFAREDDDDASMGSVEDIKEMG